MPPPASGRFVILEHHVDGVHYDLMLEVGETLWTWRLEQPPDAAPRQSAVRIGDHRLAYLTYEGPISSDRGWVRQWDQGHYVGQPSMQGMMLRFEGRRWRAEATLSPHDGNHWQLDLPDK